MHPAHALPAGRVTMGAGVSNNFVLGDADRSIEEARAATQPLGAISEPSAQQTYAAGAIAHTLGAPGLAPWVGARAGIGYTSDAGLTYTGRTVRADARHAFQNEKLALSAGGGLSGVLARPGEDTPGSSGGRQLGAAPGSSAIPGLDARGVTGWGADVPVIVGYRSDAELVQVYGGARGGYERLTGEIRLNVDPNAQTIQTAQLSASRWYVGGLLGVAVGVRPIWAVVELAANYMRFEGELDWQDTGPVKLDGVTLQPSGAVVGKF